MIFSAVSKRKKESLMKKQIENKIIYKIFCKFYQKNRIASGFLAADII